MSGVQQIHLPDLRARAGVRVEGISTVVFGRDKDHVVFCPADVKVWHPQRLGMRRTVEGAGKEFSKSCRIYSLRGQRVLLYVRAVSCQIVVVSQDPREISDSDAGRVILRTVSNAGSYHCVRTRARRRSVKACCCDLSHNRVAPAYTVHAPCDPEVLVIAGHRGPELLSLTRYHNRGQFRTDAHGNVGGRSVVGGGRGGGRSVRTVNSTAATAHQY